MRAHSTPTEVDSKRRWNWVHVVTQMFASLAQAHIASLRSSLSSHSKPAVVKQY